MNTKYQHLMLDLETADTTPTAAIFSIAAVLFNISTGKYDKDNIFYKVVDLNSCIEDGLTVSGDTIYWWLQQSDEARNSLLKNRIPLREAVVHFNTFLIHNDPHIPKVKDSELRIWGNSARFDIGILSNIFKVMGVAPYWKYRNERDVRTLVSFRPEIKDKTVFEGIRHNPVDDCIHQINYCSQIWREINVKSNVGNKIKKSTTKKQKPQK